MTQPKIIRNLEQLQGEKLNTADHSWNTLKNKPTLHTCATTGNAATVNEKTVLANVPANAKFTDTVVTVNNTLTSTSTTQALSAAQGKVLSDKIDELKSSINSIGGGDYVGKMLAAEAFTLNSSIENYHKYTNSKGGFAHVQFTVSHSTSRVEARITIDGEIVFSGLRLDTTLPCSNHSSTSSYYDMHIPFSNSFEITLLSGNCGVRALYYINK